MFDGLHCSFCGKAAAEVEKLAAGPGGIHICDECVDACQAIMAGEAPGASRAFDPSGWPKERLLGVLGPVNTTVDAYRDHLRRIVAALRAQEVSWAEIGAALGVSRQTAWERFS